MSEDTRRPVQVRRHAIIEVWDCGNPEHNHRSEYSAIRCMEKSQKSKKYFSEIGCTADRNREMALVIARGGRYSDLANKFGLSVTRCREIVLRQFRKAFFTQHHGSHERFFLWPTTEENKSTEWRKYKNIEDEFERMTGITAIRNNKEFWLNLLGGKK